MNEDEETAEARSKPRAALLDAQALAITSVLVDEIRELETELDWLIDHPSRSDASPTEADDFDEDRDVESVLAAQDAEPIDASHFDPEAERDARGVPRLAAYVRAVIRSVVERGARRFFR